MSRLVRMPTSLPSSADRDAGDAVFTHQLIGIRHQVIGGQEKRIDDDAVFRALDAVHLIGLLLNRTYSYE